MTCFDVSQHSSQLFDANVDSSLGFLLYNFVCFLSFVFVVQFVVVIGNVPTTSFYDVENWLFLRIMCGTKRLNQFLRLLEAIEVQYFV